MREQVVELRAHLQDALRGVVGEELVGYLVDEGLVVRGWDRGVVFDGVAGGVVSVGCFWGGGGAVRVGAELLLRMDSLKHQEGPSEVAAALLGHAHCEAIAPVQLLDGGNVLHDGNHLLHGWGRNPHQ